MPRLLYSLAWLVALPLSLLRLWWRGRKEAGYRQHWRERLGWYAGAANRGQQMIWLHAVSVGETRAAEPLLTSLFHHYPDARILLTHMTPTGRATGQALFARHGERLVQCYLPYDTVWMVRRFLRHFNPCICILMETEVWPNLLFACECAQLPVALVNARLSARSLRRGQRFGTLMTDAARRITLVAAQTEADAGRIRSLGAPSVAVTGSVKFDVAIPEAMLALGCALRAQIGPRPVLLCASTREGEEALLLPALLPLLQQALPGHAAPPLLLLVPRHPQRFDEVAALLAAHGLRCQRRSQLALDLPDRQQSGSTPLATLPASHATTSPETQATTSPATPVILNHSTNSPATAAILNHSTTSPATNATVGRTTHPTSDLSSNPLGQSTSRATDSPWGDPVQVLLGDSMGEMFAYYAACDLAFIGGSLLPLGGQNLIEACALGKTVLIGPHTFNFLEVSERAEAAGAARRVRDAADLAGQAAALLSDMATCRAIGAAGAAFAREHRGATARTMALLTDVIG